MYPPASGPKYAPVRFRLVALLLVFSLLALAIPTRFIPIIQTAEAASTSVVISQVYGGGGATTGSPAYKYDYVELFNTSNAAVTVGGYSLQYGSSTGNFGASSSQIYAIPAGTSIPAGKYLLVKLGGAGTVGPDFTADLTSGNLSMSATAGKVALVNSASALSCGATATPCSLPDARIIDSVAWGGSNNGEGGTTVNNGTSLDSTKGGVRKSNGCQDTDNNNSDFLVATTSTTPALVPRTSTSPAQTCGVTNNPPVINAPANPAATVQQDSAPFPVSLTGTDDNNIFNWSATPGTGISSVVVSSGQGTGSVTYTVTLQPGFSGTATFTASLSDNVNTPVTRSVNIQVNPPVVNNPPVINAPANPITTVAQDAAPFTVGLTGSDDNNVFNWSATAGTGVSNVTVTAGQGTSNVTYTVTLTPGFSGTATFTARLSDNVNPVVTQAVNIAVTPAPSSAGTVVISQVYGGGGNTGSTFTNDYIELVNHSSAPVNLSGWSVQAFVSTTNSWQVTPLTNFTLQPGQYYLIQESQGAGGTTSLPTPDAVGTIAVSSTSTKVALVSNTTTITGVCPTTGVIDLVGYGAADCYEGSGPAPTLSNTTAALRLNEGCFDTDDNANDFVSGAPNPRNSSTAAHDCTGISGFGSANPSTVLQGNSTTLTVHVAAGQNPASTGVNVVANLSSIGGSAAQSFSGSGSTFTFTATVPADNAPGLKSLPVTISDAQGRSFSTDIKLSVLPVVPDHIVISQVYGGGGNSGAPYNNDYVELYNPTNSTVTITGWTLQYASAAGTSWTNKQPLGGTIGSHQYYLVKLASGGGVGAQLPVTPNISGDINMSATTGKIALVKNSDSLSGGGCPIGTDSDIVDFVGYGTASCHEGDANAPAPSNTRALFRKNGGDTDTDQNGADFVTGAPNPRRTEPVVELGPWVAGTDPTTDDTTIPHDASVTVNFSEPVDVDAGWYNITCSVTGSHNDATVAHTNDLKTYAITPNSNFQFGEQCTVTIPKTAIHDQDTDDSGADTDTLFADYTWSFTVVGAGQPAPYTPDVHLTMGNPSNAVADVNQPLNYLMMKPTYAVSYNRDKGTPNWVSWHLDSSWYGTLARVDTFRPDPAVPADWYRVQAFDFSGTGFDRGHMTPNADRDNQNRVPINQETYLMSNMVPQSPDNNQGPWAAMEAELRTMADAGNELYIVSGPSGVGGGSSNGGTVNTVANGHVTVPSATWKVVMVLPKADGDDVARATCATQTIAVIMPNVQGIRNNDWHSYITTVDAVEQLTGYDFFSNVDPAVQACIESGTNGTNPPGASDGAYTTAEDTPVNVTLTALPSGSGAITYTIVDQPAHGTLTGTGANRTYTPAPNFHGNDSFTFNVTQNGRTSRTATVTLLVTDVNDAPVAVDDSATTNEDTPVSVSVLGNDSDVDGDTLSVSAVTQGAHGSVTNNGTSVSYAPAANYNGPDSFGYTVSDGHGGTATANVSITVTAVNDDPTAADDTLTTDEDTPATKNVIANDSDIDGGPLSVASVTQGAHGSVTFGGSDVTYTPVANYNGGDSFTYTVSDGNGGAATATVNVTVTAVNDNPVANNDTAQTDEDTAVTVDVVANDGDVDGDTLTLQLVGNATNGTVVIDNGKAVFTPASNYNGPASFTYVVSDGNGGTAQGSVSVTVNAVNDNPVAVNDSATTNEDTPVTVSVLANDSDVDGDTLSVTGAGGASQGSVTFNASGVTYTPNANANGSDSFSYTVSDGHGGTANATVNVTINAVNDAPSNPSTPGTVTIPELAAYTFTATASDVDGDTLTFSLVGAPAGASITSTGQFSWTPTEAQGGTGSAFNFSVAVSDGTVTASSPVSITVTEVNQAPTLAPIPDQTVLLGGTAAFTASGADADLPAQTLTYSLTGAVPAGASINPATGAFTWTPTAAQSGQVYTFNVRVTDNGPGSLYAEQPVTIGVGYSWTGLLSPISQNGDSVFKAGSTVPVKFQLTGPSAGITNAVVRLYVTKVADSVVGTEEAAGSTSNATEGNLFRYDASSGQYVFNLSTKGLTAGTYQLRVDMGDGVSRTALISLR
ncbi:MAG TPA: tandem-95 repeat protein [Pyrinomonadaceae bacterium]|nr:tandem-95 repeat protein [Pyrinomonadaceae bacterium]